MIRAEFLRFIEDLDHTAVSEDEWRLANVINDHLASIIPLGTAAGRRSKFILSIAYPDFDSLSIQRPQTVQELPGSRRRLSRLSALRVGPFRGFGRAQEFDLGNQVVLLYGPNGTGKSSFCEALEFALLGSVNDCSAKRIEADEYLKNARTGTFQIPKLTGIYEDGEPEEVVANIDLYRFCFVEKNRIDDFSRIASFTPNQQERLIASLFGIHEFNSFVGDFNESIDSYLPSELSAAESLSRLEASLAGDRQVVNKKAETLEALAREEKMLADSYHGGMAYDAFVQLIGTGESGAIKELTDQLGQPLRTRIGAVKVALVDAVKGVRTSWGTRSRMQEARLARANDLSFRNLYESVLAFESINQDTCPACDTPLSGDFAAVSNPYVKARASLEELSEISEIERQLEQSTRQLATRANGLMAQLINIRENLNESEKQNSYATTLHTTIVAGQADITSDWWNELLGINDESAAGGWNFLSGCLERMERQDSLILEQEEERAVVRLELNRLSSFRDKIVERNTQRTDTEQKIRDAEIALQNAEATLNEAKEKAAEEARANGVRQRIVNAYSGLMSRFQSYRDALPAFLLENLEQTVVQLYNAFNRADLEGDLIADIKLPLRPNERILFSCASAPQKYFDALHVLSEGHIRCLGLAILLSKNLESDCPVLIFDDPVNAIDDDHREGIRLTLFEDPYFSEKQIVLTCHGEEFTKDIQNLIGAAAAASTCTGYTFLPHRGDNQIRVEAIETKNYILAARNNLERNELRESLGNARRGLEWVANRIWTKVLPSAGVLGLSVTLGRPGAKPELFNVVQSLVKEIGKGSFVNPQKEQLITGLKTILGLSQHRREWEYLNKGTHEEEDRPEFDRGIVRTVVQALEGLDAAITASRQPAVLQI